MEPVLESEDDDDELSARQLELISIIANQGEAFVEDDAGEQEL
jgi:hypothetical protein